MIQMAEMTQYSLCMWQYSSSYYYPEACRKLAVEILKLLLEKYPSTLANLTLITLFSEILKISKIISSKLKNIVKDNNEYLGISHLLK
jgi:hypothetical protein